MIKIVFQDSSNYASIQEVTGIADKQLIDHAISQCHKIHGHFDIAKVIDLLLADEDEPESSNVATESTPMKQDKEMTPDTQPDSPVRYDILLIPDYI